MWHLERTSSFQASMFTKRRWALILTTEAHKWPVTAAHLLTHTATARESKEDEKKIPAADTPQVVESWLLSEFIVSSKQICVPNYASLKLILKWVFIFRESTHQLGRESRGRTCCAVGGAQRGMARDISVITEDSSTSHCQPPRTCCRHPEVYSTSLHVLKAGTT